MSRLIVLTLACVALLPLQGALAEEKPSSPFGDQALLEKHLGPACDMVEAITGHTFETRPTVHVATPSEVATILAKEFEVLPEAMLPAANRKSFAKALAKFLMAKYEPGTHTIHILPSAIELVHEAQKKLPKLGEDHLRVLLAHEATHALDFPRYDFMALRRKLKAIDAHQALNAIVEGHAEFVAEEAARRWKLTPAFERLELAIAGEDSDEGTAAERAMRAAGLSQIRFAYVQGHAFFTAIAKARGAEAVESALRNPPTSSRLIEKPALWLNPDAVAPEPALEPIAESFRWLVTGKGWQVATQRVLEAALMTQAVRVPEARRAEWLTGFQNAHMLQGTHPTGGAGFVAMILVFDTPEHAALFAELDRAVVDSTEFPPTMTVEKNEVSDGAGPKASLPGFAIHRVIKTMGQTIDVRQQVTHHGRIGIELLGLNAPHFKREHLDSALERAIAWMDDPIAAAKLPALTTPVLKSKRKILTITVVGPEGKPVPRVRITVTAKIDGVPQERSRLVDDGVLKVPLPRSPCFVWVSLARDADDKPLNFAPTERIDVGVEQETLEVRLTQGYAIRGRILEIDGKPAEGVEVEAIPGWHREDGDDMPRNVHGSVHSDAQGNFKIVGVAKNTYELRLSRSDKRVWARRQFAEGGGEPTEIRLEPVVAVTLTVKAPDGSPVAGADILVHGHRFDSFAFAKTNEKGMARLEGLDPEGVHSLNITPGKGSGPVAEHQGSDWTPHDQTIVLRPGWILHGTVKEEGKSIVAPVRLRRPHGSRTTQSKKDGTFAIYGLPEGPVQVIALPLGNDNIEVRGVDWTTVPQTDKPVTLTLFKPSKPENADASKKVKRKEIDELKPAGAGK